MLSTLDTEGPEEENDGFIWIMLLKPLITCDVKGAHAMTLANEETNEGKLQLSCKVTFIL